MKTFRLAYAEHRRREGRGLHGDDLLSLPYLRHGPLAREWAVRARSFERLAGLLPAPRTSDARPGRLLDLGAGNGWLSCRLARGGWTAAAVDTRTDDVDGLGAAARPDAARPGAVRRVAASFTCLPFPEGSFDVAVFNASLHCAVDLGNALDEARRVLTPTGRLFVVDSPFYRRDADGRAMVAEKRRTADRVFGDRAEVLMSVPAVEYLTRERLERAAPQLRWRRHRVRYPLWYELRPLVARLRRRRPPSRFDVWEGAGPES